ncbi:MAG: hypothetical protein HY080_03045 [Gammaproteobacteria bacterium]|nr:hypothetical protein [Gammaproteobacteria bacterium]
MQMAAFFNNNEGVLVIANDMNGGISDWELIPGVLLRIRFYGNLPEVQVYKIEPTIAAAAEKYRLWAANQFWVRDRKRNAPRLNFISVASSSSLLLEKKHLDNIVNMVQGPLGVWFTQWREHPFDRMYPDYKPKEPIEFQHFLADLLKRDILALPYINSLLWDENQSVFHDSDMQSALRTNENTMVKYNKKLNFLYYACPFSKEWQDCILNARNSLMDSNYVLSSGVYLDMLAASAPMQCWAYDHGHEPGDGNAWIHGLRNLLKQTAGRIMVEGCAEVYLDLIDYALMDLYTPQLDSVPLWSLVYGDLVQPVGWRLPSGIDAVQFNNIVKRAKTYGVLAFASPWMTSEAESDLLVRGLINAPNNFHGSTQTNNIL